MRPAADLLAFLVVLLFCSQLSATTTEPPLRFIQFNEFTKSEQHSLTIAASPDGDRLMGVWVSRLQNQSKPGVYGRVFGADWSIVRPEFPLFEDDMNCASPTVVATPDGFVVSWEVQGPGNAVVKARGFDRAGRPLSPPIELSQTDTRSASPSVFISFAGEVGVAWRSAGTVEGAWLDSATLQPRSRWSVGVGETSAISAFSPVSTDDGAMICFGDGRGTVGVICVDANDNRATLTTWPVANAVEPGLWSGGQDEPIVLIWTDAGASERAVGWGIVRTSLDDQSGSIELLTPAADVGRLPGSSPVILAYPGRPVLLLETQDAEGGQSIRVVSGDRAHFEVPFPSNMLQANLRSGQHAMLGDEVMVACWGRFEPGEALNRGDAHGVGVVTFSRTLLQEPGSDDLLAIVDGFSVLEPRSPVELPEQVGVEPIDPVKLSENGEQGFMVSENPTGLSPADPAVAVGVSQIVTAVNGEIYVHSRQGDQLRSWPLLDLFQSCCPWQGTSVDPVAMFDADIARFVVAAKFDSAQGLRIGLAISKQGDFTGPQVPFDSEWDVYNWEDPEPFDNYDYPKLGVAFGYYFITYIASDRTGVVGFNRQSRTFDFVESFGIRRGNFAVMPTRDLDPGSQIQYLVTEFTNGRTIALRAIYPDPITGDLVMTDEWFPVPVERFLQPFNMRQAGSGFRVPVRSTLANHAVKRGGHLWYAFASSGEHTDSTPKVRWYRINPNGWPLSGNDPVLVHEGVLDLGPGVASAFPGIAVDNGGPNAQKLVMVYARSSPTEPMSVGRSVISHDGTVLNSEVWKSSATPPTFFRWGDYFTVEPDPTDSSVFWGHGQYQGLTAWRTWVGRVDLDDL